MLKHLQSKQGQSCASQLSRQPSAISPQPSALFIHPISYFIPHFLSKFPYFGKISCNFFVYLEMFVYLCAVIYIIKDFAWNIQNY